MTTRLWTSSAVGVCEWRCPDRATEAQTCGDETLLFGGLRMETLTFIGTYIIPLLTAAIGWIVGSRKRKNDFLKDLQASINLLSAENKRLLEEITNANAEIVAVRKENEELKASVDRLCTENSQLKDEVRQLREQIKRQK